MLNPMDLPPELFNTVVDYAIDGEDDLQSFCNFCLVDRQWYATASHRLYFKWTYNGDAHSFTSLWKFLRTMLHSVQLAGYVRVLDIQDWGFHSDPRSGQGASFPQEDLTAIHDAVRKAGIQEMEPSIDEAIHNNDRGPFMALLLTLLPNLKSIYAHTHENDPYLTQVLRLSLDNRGNRFQQQAFQKLEEAQFMSEWHCPPSIIGQPRDNYALGLEYILPIFRLPNLRKLSVFDFKPEQASVHFDNCTGTSPVTHLTLVHHDDSYISALDAYSLLTLPKALVSLSIYLNDCCLFPERDPKQVSNDELWLALEQHQDSIENLDFYRDCTAVSPPTYREGNFILVHSAPSSGLIGFASSQKHFLEAVVVVILWPHSA
jgi:hypothetical protein